MVPSLSVASGSQLPNDVVSEKLISFAQAAAMFPSSRRDRPVSPSCIWRWFRHGVRLANGQVVRLEAVKVAGRHLTSVEAVRRFVASQQIDDAAVPDRPTENRPTSRSPARRQRDSERALEKVKRRHHVTDKSAAGIVKQPTVAR